MTANAPPTPASLTGRIQATPDVLLNDEVLEPQFRYECRWLLPHYVTVEKALLAEYARMGVMTPRQVGDVFDGLARVSPETIVADPRANMSDICFAIERVVTDHLPEPVPTWHIDRSRNDQQACAQLMLGRGRLLEVAGSLIEAVHAALRLADKYVDDPMPGYTHLQAAQVVTPAFVLTALSAHLLHSLERLLATFAEMNGCPLGSGAMAGGELAWDRARMARLLGFGRAEAHALTGVASRSWVLEFLAELSTLGVGISRFVTDMMAWASNEYGLLTLPDELAGISSAMPQKKNYPILERIRGKSAHLLAAYVDSASGQRSAGYSNSVEVSKEATSQLVPTCQTAGTMLRLLTAVLDGANFDRARMRAACEREFVGGSSLATALVLAADLPWREAQVAAGRYIVAAQDAGHAPADIQSGLLDSILADLGHRVPDAHRLLTDAFDADRNLRGKVTAGAASPDAVRQLVLDQESALARVTREWQERSAVIDATEARVDTVLREERRS